MDVIPLLATQNWDVKHGWNARGIYTGTKFVFTAEGSRQILRVKSLGVANELVRALKTWPAYLSDLIRQEDLATLYDLDLLCDWRIREEKFPRRVLKRSIWSHQLLPRIGGASIAFGLSALFFLIVISQYNNRCDDELRWRVARANPTATSFRIYVAARPDGLHVAEAQDEVARLYGKAAEDFRRYSGNDSPEGTESVIKMLEFARQSGRYTVFVSFSGTDEIPPNIEEQLRARHGLPKIAPVKPSFSSSMNEARETRILAQITDAFGKVIPGDILRFVAGSGASQDIQFGVAYVIKPSGGLYYPTDQEHLQEASRNWYTGVSFDWNFQIAVPNIATSTFAFPLQSEPAQLFNVAYQTVSGREASNSIWSTQGPDAGEVYSAMADSAFKDFGDKLLKKLSLK
jgi:hypothetical protein